VGGDAAERVVRLEAGDVISVRTGDVSWWYNDDANGAGAGADLSIVFMGDTACAVSPGDISYFFLAGGNSVLGGLDAAAWAPGVTAEQASVAFKSQPAVGGETLLLNEEVPAGSVFVTSWCRGSRSSPPAPTAWSGCR
jgi:hypothetical protein